MSNFIVAHRGDDGPAPCVGGGQHFHVAAEVLLDLALGFDHEAEAGLVAGQACADADREGPGVPQRIAKAGTRPEFLQALLGPCQMIFFLARCPLQAGARARITGDERLRRRRAPARRPRRYG